MSDIKLERQKLYEEVWQEPMEKVAKRYNLSDNVMNKNLKIFFIILTKKKEKRLFHRRINFF